MHVLPAIVGCNWQLCVASIVDHVPLLQPAKVKSKRELEKEEKEREKAMWNKLKKEELLTMPISKRRSDDLRLSLVIGVNGWIANRADFLRLWKNLRPPDAEVYTLVWESKELIQLNYALTSFLTTQVAQQVAQKSAAMVLGRTWGMLHLTCMCDHVLPSMCDHVLPSMPGCVARCVPLMLLHRSSIPMQPTCCRHAHDTRTPHTAVVAAVAPAIMLNTASGLLIDNAWAVMVERSIKAGKLLAHSLMTVRRHGASCIRCWHTPL